MGRRILIAPFPPVDISFLGAKELKITTEEMMVVVTIAIIILLVYGYLKEQKAMEGIMSGKFYS